MVRRELLRPGVDFCFTKGTLQPSEEMLDDALIQLMEHIQCNGLVDICVREILPEWVHHRFDSCITTCTHKNLCIWIIKCWKCIQYFPQIPILILISTFLKVIFRTLTPRTLPCFDPCGQNVLRVITHEKSKDRVTPTSNTIPTCHHSALKSCLLQRLHNMADICVKEIDYYSMTQCMVGDVLKMRGGKVELGHGVRACDEWSWGCFQLWGRYGRQTCYKTEWLEFCQMILWLGLL